MYFNSNEKQHLIVIGGNVSGLAAANQARRNSSNIEITVLESGNFISYGTCGLPYFISGVVDDINKLFVYSPEFFEKEKKINILTGHQVIGLNPSKKGIAIKLRSDNSLKTLNYDKLVIASGAVPIDIGVENLKAPNFFNFRNVEDALSLKDYISKNSPRRALIVGGGSIGLLLAEALLKIGIKPVIVEKSNNIFNDFEEEISTILYKKATLDGCEIINNSSLNLVVKDDTNIIKSASIYNIADEKLSSIETDLVLFCAGIRANTSFLEGTSIELGKNHGIKTTQKLQTSYSNIYACGDCCCVKNIVTGKYDYIPTANNAAKMGRIAGGNITGGEEIFSGSVGTKVDAIFGFEIAKTGIGLKEATDLGFNAVRVIDTFSSHAKAIPGAKEITISLIADFNSRKILGVQMIGATGVAKRIDIFATAITHDLTIDDVYMLDLSYSPGTSTVWDPVNKICGKMVLNFKKRRF